MASTVLIMGASQGIGKEIAWLFACNGYNVVLAARQPERLEALAHELRMANHSAIAVSTDVRDSEQVKHFIDRAIAEYGAINMLINNAGIYLSAPIKSFTG